MECNCDQLNKLMVGGKGSKEQANHGQNVTPRKHDLVQNTFKENLMGKDGSEDPYKQIKGWRSESMESNPP